MLSIHLSPPEIEDRHGNRKMSFIKCASTTSVVGTLVERTSRCLILIKLFNPPLCVIKGKLLESQILVQQAANNTKEQFANSPDLSNELMNAIIDAFAAHTTMSKQALDSEKVRSGLRDILLGPAQLYESLRARGENRMS